jgi:hypothetical protein
MITEEHFQGIVMELSANLKAYEEQKIKHYAFTDRVDHIFANYGIAKSAFYKELNSRCGIQTNETREKKRNPIVKKVRKTKAE